MTLDRDTKGPVKESGNRIEIKRYEKPNKWPELAFKVATSGLSKSDIDLIAAVVEVMLKGLLKQKRKQMRK